MSEPGQSLQSRYSPASRCFGCGPANDQGLRIESHDADASAVAGELVADWQPLPHHAAFDGVLNGGIIGALLDCHSNWTAAWWLMRRHGAASPPCTVTADFHVKLLRPTPSGAEVLLRAHVTDGSDDRAIVESTLEAGGKVTATCRGTFVAVKEGHPAFHRW